jgi:hypothetical protein
MSKLVTEFKALPLSQHTKPIPPSPPLTTLRRRHGAKNLKPKFACLVLSRGRRRKSLNARQRIAAPTVRPGAA